MNQIKAVLFDMDGVLIDDSVHPKWSCAKTEEDSNVVIEVAEKRPISRHAIAGLYYFRGGGLFVEAAQKSILKNSAVNGFYYIAPTMNEILLQGGLVTMEKIQSYDYHSFYNPSHFAEFEAKVRSGEVTFSRGL